MKRVAYLLIPVLLLAFGCAEDVNITIPEDVDVANITGVTVYGDNLATLALRSTNIDSDAKTVLITFNAAQDLTKLKVSLTISTGATITTPLGTGFLDFSQPKTVTVVSPGLAVTSIWTITFVNP